MLERQKLIEKDIRDAKKQYRYEKTGLNTQNSVEINSGLDFVDMRIGLDAKKNDTIYNVIGSSRAYYESINSDIRYKIVYIGESQYAGLYDFTYLKNKK